MQEDILRKRKDTYILGGQCFGLGIKMQGLSEHSCYLISWKNRGNLYRIIKECQKLHSEKLKILKRQKRNEDTGRLKINNCRFRGKKRT